MKRNQKMKKEKPTNLKDSWVKLLKFSRKYNLFIIIAILAVIGATVIQVASPKILQQLVTEIAVIAKLDTTTGLPLFTRIDMDRVKQITITLVTLFVIAMLLNATQSFIMSTVTRRVENDMRKKLAEKINKIPLKYFDSTNSGDTISRVINDVDTIGQTMNQSISSTISAIILFLGSILMMFITNWILAFAAIGSSIIGFLLVGFIMSKSQKHFIAQQMQIGELNGFVEEIYTNHSVVKSYNASKKSIKDFRVINDKLYNSAWKSQFFSGLMMPLFSFIGNLGYVAVSIIGAVLVANTIIEFSVIIAFMSYVGFFTNSLGSMAQGINSFQLTAAASERVFQFLEQEELENEDYKQEKISDTKGIVEFKNVKFGYNPEKVIINDFSAKINAGEKVAIVGPTGAGKTTIVNLLMRFYEINEGSIKIDGINTNDVTRENVHDQFCMVLQDTWIFEGTVYDNIIYSQENVTKEDVVKACKTLGLDHFIRTLSDGYETILTDKSSLSEGQKQLITIARAMIKNSPLLILDEATSSVDTRTEALIQKAMDELMKGRTSFVIAHRLSTIKNADLILVMKNGDIIESGNHDKLLSENGFYAELYNSQFQLD
ncbi:ABC transporter ATP-binding protein [Haploplasma axanthum]|uniref:ABC-type multidrug/protein/lipid transport system ATPase component n=1 Tax=Haploplasma axanthum TaxID=29552 RepID=A0A449BEY1_HAPAX|nr:ABC transporter ATP-binding protein [Haploplasma axanthum]VEU80985.1 ABC-type multidrug/protein/lipid transport system ATPase component [Haploplasma axanthum]